MALRNRSSKQLNDDVNEIAKSTVGGTSVGGWAGLLTGVASAVALVFSAISIYHSVLKQPELRFYVSPVLHYTRDARENNEVFAVPMTIANHGARDGTVLDVELTARSLEGGPSKVFYSAYQVDGSFFVKPGGFDREKRQFERVDRPKQPFAPISIAGRSSFSGTLLFYTKGEAFPKIVSGSGTFEIELRLRTRLDDSLGALDQWLAKPPNDVRKTVKLGYFSESNAKRGNTYRLIDTDWRAAAKSDAQAEEPSKE
ncbi:MAG: hypothetical protein AAFO75_09405 [Pseudomonadota bacterium]